MVCVDATTGKQLWNETIDGPKREDAYSGYLQEHGYASGTPVSDGNSVFAFFGKAGVVAYSLDGKKLWQKDLGQMSSNRRWGSGASPVIFNDVLIVNAYEEARAIFGLSTRIGEELWKAEYDSLELCFATPVLAPGEGDVMEAVISMPTEAWGLNALNGKLRWYCETATSGNVSPSVVVGKGQFFTFGGFPEEQTNAITRGGRKNVTGSHKVWQSRDSSYVATPLLVDDHLYWVTDRGHRSRSGVRREREDGRDRAKNASVRPGVRRPPGLRLPNQIGRSYFCRHAPQRHVGIRSQPADEAGCRQPRPERKRLQRHTSRRQWPPLSKIQQIAVLHQIEHFSVAPQNPRTSFPQHLKSEILNSIIRLTRCQRRRRK